MTNTTEDKPGPAEVWLTKSDGIGFKCRVVYEDESTRELGVDALSMRGAQREMTGWFINKGFTPAGRWEAEIRDDDGEVLESVRVFRPTTAAQ